MIEPTDETPVTSEVFPGLRSQPDLEAEPQGTLESRPETRFHPEVTTESQHDFTNDRPVVSFEKDFLDDDLKHQVIDESIPDRLAGNTGSPDSFGESFPDREAESSPERRAESFPSQDAETIPGRFVETSPDQPAESHPDRVVEYSPEGGNEEQPSSQGKLRNLLCAVGL